MYLIKNILPKLITRACTICVAISFLLFLLGNAMALPTESLKLDLEDYFLFFIFSLILSGSFFIFRLKLAKPILVAIHFPICAIDFFATFLLSGKLNLQNTAAWFVAIVLLILVYALIFGAFILLRYLLQKLNAKKEATSIASKNKVTYEKRF